MPDWLNTSLTAPNPVQYFVPIFILAILLEGRVLLQSKHANYTIKESLASISMGLGILVIKLFTKALYIPLFFWVYEYKLFSFFSGGPQNTFSVDLYWFTQHWYLVVLLFFLDDFTFYWHHRLSHTIRLLWAGHVNHHSSTEYNFATALRQGWFEDVYKYIFWLWLPWLGFHPLLVYAMLELNLVYQFFVHTEFGNNWFGLGAVFNTPSHHRVHHAANVRYLDKNYGGIFIIWDKLFGTFQAENEPVVYGLTKNIRTQNPFCIATSEFQSIANDLKKTKNLKHWFHYLFNQPGYSHNGPDLRSKTLQKNEA